MRKDTTISIRVPTEVREQLEALAAVECRSMGAQALQFIIAGLSTKQKPAKERLVKAAMQKPDDVAPQVWLDYMEIRRAKKLPITQSALDDLRKQADKAGMTLNEALKECCSRGWAGFKAEWVQTQGGKQNALEQANRRAVEDFLNG